MLAMTIRNKEYGMIWPALNLTHLLIFFWLLVFHTIIRKTQDFCGVLIIFQYSELLWLINDSSHCADISVLMMVVQVHFVNNSIKLHPFAIYGFFLNENLAKYYEPHENITVDEQIFPYRGRTKFTQFIPSKPAKYGIKVWWACDSKTKYPLQGKLHTGKDPGAEREVRQGENVLLEMANRYTNSGRTTVAVNFFVTLDGAKRLDALGLALVGTIRSNKKCLSKEVKKDATRLVLSSLFGFHENLISLCSYVPKKNMAVIARQWNQKRFCFTMQTKLVLIAWIKWSPITQQNWKQIDGRLLSFETFWMWWHWLVSSFARRTEDSLKRMRDASFWKRYPEHWFFRTSKIEWMFTLKTSL